MNIRKLNEILENTERLFSEIGEYNPRHVCKIHQWVKNLEK
jgi:hypothetical protein